MKEKAKKLLLPGLFASTVFAPLMVPILIAEADGVFNPWLVFGFLLFWGVFGWAQAVFLPKVKIVWYMVISIVVPFVASFFLCRWLFDYWWIGLIGGIAASFIACISAWRCLPPLGYTLTGATVGAVLISHSVVYILLSVLNYLFVSEFHANLNAILPIGLISFVVCCFLMNWVFTMRLSSNDANTTHVPASIRKANTVLTTVFTGAALIIAFIPALKNGFQKAWAALLKWLIGLKDLIPWDTTAVVDYSPVGGAMIEPTPTPIPEEVMEAPLFLQYAKEILVLLVAAATVIALLYGLFRIFRRLWRMFVAHLRSWMKRWGNNASEAYEDEQEQAEAWTRVKQDARAWMDKLTQRLKPRPRLEDMPDDRARLRALYQWVLEKQLKKGKTHTADTPNELATQLNAEEEAFFDGYNVARYSEKVPDPGAVKSGKDVLRRA